MKKTIFVFLIAILVLATTLIKNSTKKIDQKIFEAKENIIFLKSKYELELLDYNYLSSPKKLMNHQNQYFENDLIPRKLNAINQIVFDKKSSNIIIINNSLNE